MHFEHPNIGSLPHSYFMCRVMVDFLQYSFEQFGHLNFTPKTKIKSAEKLIIVFLKKTNILTNNRNNTLYTAVTGNFSTEAVKIKIKQKRKVVLYIFMQDKHSNYYLKQQNCNTLLVNFTNKNIK